MMQTNTPEPNMSLLKYHVWKIIGIPLIGFRPLGAWLELHLGM